MRRGGGGAWRGGSTVHTLWCRGFDSCVLMRQVWPMYPTNVAGKWHRTSSAQSHPSHWPTVEWPTFSPLHTRAHTRTLKYPLRLQPFRPLTWLWLPTAHLSPAQRVDASPKQTERPVNIIDSLRGRFLARVWFLFYPLCTWSASGPFFAQFIRTTTNSSIWIIESGSEFYVLSCSLWHNIMKFEWIIVVWMS